MVWGNPAPIENRQAGEVRQAGHDPGQIWYREVPVPVTRVQAGRNRSKDKINARGR